MAFETTNEATRLWIKGREFTVARLLGDAYKDQAERYVGGALVIFRLAPQDYHRFHSPVDGTIGPMSYITGEYYTVNVSDVLAQIRCLTCHWIRSHKRYERLWTFMERMCARLCQLIARSLGA